MHCHLVGDSMSANSDVDFLPEGILVLRMLKWPGHRLCVCPPLLAPTVGEYKPIFLFPLILVFTEGYIPD